MKMNQKILDKPLEELVEVLTNPEKQKDLTVGDIMQLVSMMDAVAEANAKLQNPQNPSFDYEAKLKDLERRIGSLENKFSTIYKAFVGDYE